MTMVIGCSGEQGAQALRNALADYKVRLERSLRRSRQRLEEFEQRYGVSTKHFLSEMTAEDLPDGDIEYVEWAGEAKILAGMEAELRDLEHVNLQLR